MRGSFLIILNIKSICENIISINFKLGTDRQENMNLRQAKVESRAKEVLSKSRWPQNGFHQSI